jgi:hypothetical protein
MAILYPTSLDTFVNPTESDNLDTTGVDHATQHADKNDAIEALEAKVGIDGSAVTTSHEYRITQVESGNNTVTGNKTFSGTVTLNKALISVPDTLTDGANIATDASLGNHFRVTLGGNRTLDNPTNLADGQRIVWEFIQDGTGSRTIALGSKFAFGTDITGVTLTTTASKRDFMTAIYNSTADKLHVVAFVKGY